MVTSVKNLFNYCLFCLFGLRTFTIPLSTTPHLPTISSSPPSLPFNPTIISPFNVLYLTTIPPANLLFLLCIPASISQTYKLLESNPGFTLHYMCPMFCQAFSPFTLGAFQLWFCTSSCQQKVRQSTLILRFFGNSNIWLSVMNLDMNFSGNFFFYFKIS